MIFQSHNQSRLGSTPRARHGASALVGLAREMMADGTISCAEVHELVSWVAEHPEMINSFPGNVIAQRLERYLADQYIDADEVADLSSLLAELTRNEPPPPATILVTLPPFTKPAPRVFFEGQEFVFTGRFYYGTRKACQRAVLERGGSCQDVPSLSTNYVVIGTLPNGNGAESPFAHNLNAVMAMTDGQASIVVVSEDHWAAHL
jgi:NAD-dependent DNA ligase